MAHWLFKTEPETFSFEDLQKSPKAAAPWDGVRNYQARNLLRDEVKVGDEVLIYHSRLSPPEAVGRARVIRGGYEDPTALDSTSPYFDEKSAKLQKSRWICVDIQAVASLKRAVTLDEMRHSKGLEEMPLLRRGQRLSIQPLSPREWDIILKLAESPST